MQRVHGAHRSRPHDAGWRPRGLRQRQRQRVDVCPLTWNTPIDELFLGHVPDPSVQGKSLFNIVSSFVSGRPDGALCSSCHNSSSSYPYHPNVAPNGSAAIDPFLPASGNQTWICASDPWGPQFVNLPVTTYPHTVHLKEAVQKWLSDGGIR
jgi:hypothetical protein